MLGSWEGAGNPFCLSLPEAFPKLDTSPSSLGMLPRKHSPLLAVYILTIFTELHPKLIKGKMWGLLDFASLCIMCVREPGPLSLLLQFGN